MNRDETLLRINAPGKVWDILVIGGGATGLGIALDASTRGHSVLLVERGDFANATSSRSTKLIHGGVRYLQQGNISLVKEALRERGYLRSNAPHFVQEISFIIPSYAWWESPFYGLGLKFYDKLSGEYSFGTSRHLSRNEVVDAIPTIKSQGLLGGTQYSDGQFDDAKLAIALAQTASKQGAAIINYCFADSFIKRHGKIIGAILRDTETGEKFEVRAKVVINATGPFCDDVRRLDDGNCERVISPSQGTHIVLPQEFLPGNAALMVPRTDDGRILFAIPWQYRVIVGTTDVPVTNAVIEPQAYESEIDFILETFNRYLAKRFVEKSDICSVFSGIRPLVSANKTRTASISRDHLLFTNSVSGLISITSGKWTTYRRMAEDAVDKAQIIGDLNVRECITRKFPIENNSDVGIKEIANQDLSLCDLLHPSLPLAGAEVLWYCRNEMARKVVDVLARRSRCLLLDAQITISIAPVVAELMAKDLGRGSDWVAQELKEFQIMAHSYRPQQCQ